MNLDVEVDPDLSEAQTSEVTLTATDQQDDVVSGLELKYNFSLTDNDDTTEEIYTVDEETAGDSRYPVSLGKTNDEGVLTFDVTLPSTVDQGDGFTLTFVPPIDSDIIVEDTSIKYHKE